METSNQPQTNMKPLDQLQDPNFLRFLEEGYSDMLFYTSSTEAKKAALGLEKILNAFPDFRNENPELNAKYENLILRLKFVAIPNLPSEDVIDLLQKYILFGLRIPDYDLKKFLHGLIVTITFDLDLANWLDKAQKALEISYSLLGLQEILDGNKKIPQTVGNWIKLYNKNVGLDLKKPRGVFEQVKFINENPNVRNLSEQDKELFKKLLKIYDWFVFFGYQTNPPEKEQEKYLKQAEKIIQEILALEKGNGPVEKQLVQSKPKPIPIPPAPHGESIEELRDRLKTAAVDIPKRAPTAPVYKPQAREDRLNPVQKEIEREVETPELPSHPSGRIPDPESSSGLRERNSELRKRQSIPQSNLSLKSIDDIKVIEDLKKIEVGHLHQGPLPDQISKIRYQISRLARANNLLPYNTVSVFEQSPLFKQYLFLGGSLVADRRQDRKAAFSEAVARLKASGQQSMSLAEFEAVADLRKEIERM